MKTYQQRFAELKVELMEDGIVNGDWPSDEVNIEIDSALCDDESWDHVWPTK
jgi:hypothetical protein